MADNISETILDDLCSRFLVNLPAEELSDPIRACFQIELAYWFYTDFYKSENNKVCSLRDFIRKIFFYLPCLKHYSSTVDEIIDGWRKYKSAVPTYGAILVDESCENVLLVQGFYATSRWGFPKGKVNEDELPHICAIREVKEETGFDISSLIDPELYLERTLSDTVVRLYLVIGVPKSFTFHPETRNEIRKIQWFCINDLPTDRHDNSKNAIGVYANNFFHIIPFVNFMKEYIRIKNGLPPTTSSFSESSKKINNNNNRPYSPGNNNNRQFFNRNAAGQFSRQTPGTGRFASGHQQQQQQQRQRTQSLNVGVCLNDETTAGSNGHVTNKASNNYEYNVNSINNSAGATSSGRNATAASTTPKFTKQQKKQKNTPKQRLFNDEENVECRETKKLQSTETLSSRAVVGDVCLAKVWQNVKLDWSYILKDL